MMTTGLLIVLGSAVFLPFLHADLKRADAERRRREWLRANPQAAAIRRAIWDISRGLAQVGLSMETVGRRIREHFEKAAQR